MVGSWLTRFINLTVHIRSGLANLKLTWTKILPRAMAQIKTITVSFTKTCITLLQHFLVNLPSDNCQTYISLTEVHNSCHHKPFLRGGDTAKPRGYIRMSLIDGDIADPVRGLGLDVDCAAQNLRVLREVSPHNFGTQVEPTHATQKAKQGWDENSARISAAFGKTKPLSSWYQLKFSMQTVQRVGNDGPSF